MLLLVLLPAKSSQVPGDFSYTIIHFSYFADRSPFFIFHSGRVRVLFSFFSLLVAAAAWRHLAQTTVIMIKLDYGCFPFFTPTSHQIQQCSEQRAAQFSVLAVLFPDLTVQLPPPASSLSRPHLRPSSEFQFMAHPMWEYHAGVYVCVCYINNYQQSFMLHTLAYWEVEGEREKYLIDTERFSSAHNASRQVQWSEN